MKNSRSSVGIVKRIWVIRIDPNALKDLVLIEWTSQVFVGKISGLNADIDSTVEVDIPVKVFIAHQHNISLPSSLLFTVRSSSFSGVIDNDRYILIIEAIHRKHCFLNPLWSAIYHKLIAVPICCASSHALFIFPPCRASYHTPFCQHFAVSLLTNPLPRWFI